MRAAQPRRRSFLGLARPGPTSLLSVRVSLCCFGDVPRDGELAGVVAGDGDAHVDPGEEADALKVDAVKLVAKVVVLDARDNVQVGGRVRQRRLIARDRRRRQDGREEKVGRERRAIGRAPRPPSCAC